MKIGIIGTGLMGSAIAKRLLAKQQTAIAYNRTASKLEDLQQAGATTTTSAATALKQAEVVILMLSDATAIREVLLNQECQPHLSGTTVIQMGTIAPAESREIAEAIANYGGEYLEAPVLGSIPQIKTGELIVMVGATPEQYQQWLWLWQIFSTQPLLVGEVGTAAAMKLALNQLIASLTAAFSLSLSFVQQQGIEVEQFMSVLRQSALYAPTFDKKLQRMGDRAFDNPNFPTKHLLKDTDLFIQAAQEVDLNTAGLEGVRQIIEGAIALGWADKDYSALYCAINPEA